MTEHGNDHPDNGKHFGDEEDLDVDKDRPATAEDPQFTQNLRKAAEDTAYAAVGFVGLVADKAKDFYEDQKRQYAEANPDAESDQAAKNFLAQLRKQLDSFIDDMNRGFRDLADRGRTAAKDADAPGTPRPTAKPGPAAETATESETPQAKDDFTI